MKNKGKILIFSGCAGSGKGTVLKELFGISDRFRTTVSLTTRKPRPGEQEGVHYYFTDKEDFLRRAEAGEMAEYAEYCGNYYGTLKSELRRLTDEGYVAVLEIETAGALQIMKQLPEHCSIFIAPPTYTVLEQRLRHRGTETEDKILERLATAKEEILLSRHYQHLIVNYDGKMLDCARAIEALCQNESAEENPALCRDKDSFPARFLAN